MTLPAQQAPGGPAGRARGKEWVLPLPGHGDEPDTQTAGHGLTRVLSFRRPCGRRDQMTAFIGRREFITLLGGAAAAWPLAARAQQQPQTQIPRIGYLGFDTPAGSAPRVEALRAGLRELGYVEGKNILIEFRWAETVDQLHRLAGELAQSNVDIIFATSSTEVEPARQATKTIPIVFATHADPVGLGHVASLPRPGGNMTGLAMIQTDLAPKRLEIFKEVLPHATRFGVLWDARAPSYRPVLQAVEPASKTGVQLKMIPVSAAEDFDGALAAMAGERCDGVIVHAADRTLRFWPSSRSSIDCQRSSEREKMW